MPNGFDRRRKSTELWNARQHRAHRMRMCGRVLFSRAQGPAVGASVVPLDVQPYYATAHLVVGFRAICEDAADCAPVRSRVLGTLAVRVNIGDPRLSGPGINSHEELALEGKRSSADARR